MKWAVVALFCLVAFAAASEPESYAEPEPYAENVVEEAPKGEYVEEKSYVEEEAYDDKKEASYDNSYIYQGKYPGKCGSDGLYFRDEASFVFCSNGNSYVQPCAPGTRNSAYENFRPGGSYGYRDFCDVNLVDDGYAAKRYKPAPARPEPAYYRPQPVYRGGYYRPRPYGGPYDRPYPRPYGYYPY